MTMIESYPWFNDSYLLIKSLFNKEKKLPYHILFSVKDAANVLISQVSQILLCTENEHIKKNNICINCKLIKENNHPDIYNIKYDFKSNLNDSHVYDILKFSSNRPLYGDKKIVSIFYEKEVLTDQSLDFIKYLLRTINTYYSYVKVILKVNFLTNKIFSSLLPYCIHIHINKPSENICLLWIKDNYIDLTKKFNNIQILTALRININNIKDTIYFLNNSWELYNKFIEFSIVHLKDRFWFHILTYIFLDIQNSKLYLDLLTKLLLDIFKVILYIHHDSIINYKFYDKLKDLFNKKTTHIFQKNNLALFLKDIFDCNSTFIKFPLLNKEIFLYKLYTKWYLKSYEIRIR